MPCGALSFLPTNVSHLAAAASPALFDEAHGEWMSYGTLREKIQRVSALFSAKNRGLIFCCVPRSVDGVIAYLSASASGNAVAVIDPALPRLQEAVVTYQPEWIVAPADSVFPAYQDCGSPFPSLKVWKRQIPSELSLHPDFYLLFLTSGSTGSPKAVRLSYENMARNTVAIISSLGLTASERSIAHLPLFYSFGLSVLHTQLAVGGSCLLTERGLMSREFWQGVREEKATLFPGVPYHYDMLRRLGLDRLDVPSLKIFIQAGGKMRSEVTGDLLQQVQNCQGKLFVLYGQTEASPRMSCLPLHQYPEKIGTVGRALDGGSFDIHDDEIIYSGANVMLGYAENRADLALGDVQQGRLATGDRGSVDADGFLTVSGRQKRFAKLFGQRIALEDLEVIASRIADAVAIDTDDKIILMTADVEENVCERMKEVVIAETKLPATWLDVRKVSSLPLQPNGKVDYLKARGMI